jgi:glycosyltransferase involved in cell wall biosynthesis
MLTSKPISVIIPVLNCQRTIGRCLEAILAQDYPHEHYEIILVDNGSTDQSISIMKEYPVKILNEHRAHNSYMARNTGIRNASGEIIVFLDADCVPGKRWLENLMTPFVDEEIGCVAGEVLNSPSTNLIQGFYSYVDFLGQEHKVSNGIRALGAGNIAFRREIFDQIGLYDENFRWGGDNDFGLRLQKETSYRIFFSREAIVEHFHRYSLKGYFKQAFTYGLGKGRFRIKHSNPPFKKYKSLWTNIVVLMRYILGIILLPYRSIKVWQSGRTALESIAYPLLDKVFMITEQMGIIYFMARNSCNRH